MKIRRIQIKKNKRRGKKTYHYLSINHNHLRRAVWRRGGLDDNVNYDGGVIWMFIVATFVYPFGMVWRDMKGSAAPLLSLFLYAGN